MKKWVFLFLLLANYSSSFAQDKVDGKINELIRKHGLEESQVMETASWMMDVYGPRLTGSPMLDKATNWAQKTLKDWGMQNVHLEEWGPFGRGWELEKFTMQAHTPNYWQIIAYPKAWSPSTDGEVTGEVVYLQVSEAADLEKYKGKLKGKFVLLDTIRNTKEWFDPLASRLESDKLLELANAAKPGQLPRRNYNQVGGLTFNRLMWQFLTEEAPLAVLDRSSKGDLGTVFVSRAITATGRAWTKNNPVVPQATLAVEHYNRIFRLLLKGIPVKLSLEIKSQYVNPDEMEHNIIAEIPGTDLKEEVVIFGAHFDSWHTATGATDNGAGSAVMMEVARILLKTIEESGQQPRRTLRLALWTGEEQGLLGSRGYVEKHYAVFPPEIYTPQSLKPAQKKVAAYFNLDNGTGKIRGVYLQGNPAIRPIFRTFLAPFADLDAQTITLSNAGGTDHLAFDAVGIPAFQFIQESIAYFNRTHHSNMDNWDHLIAEDLQQAATIIASFVWHTAQRTEQLPRKVMEE